MQIKNNNRSKEIQSKSTAASVDGFAWAGFFDIAPQHTSIYSIRCIYKCVCFKAT